MKINLTFNQCFWNEHLNKTDKFWAIGNSPVVLPKYALNSTFDQFCFNEQLNEDDKFWPIGNAIAL